MIINTKKLNYEIKVLKTLKKYKVSFICLAGYMKILSNYIIRNYRGRIINIHPSLLPKFKGLNTFSRMLENKEIKAGCTVHYVNEKLDGGNTIHKKLFFIKNKDNEKILRKKNSKIRIQSTSRSNY